LFDESLEKKYIDGVTLEKEMNRRTGWTQLQLGQEEMECKKIILSS